MEGVSQEAVGRNPQACSRWRGTGQEQLAHELSVYRTFMGSLEGGERNLFLRSVGRLADASGM